jgi:hypothetical protein
MYMHLTFHVKKFIMSLLMKSHIKGYKLVHYKTCTFFFFLSVLNMYLMTQSYTDGLKHMTIEFSLIYIN